MISQSKKILVDTVYISVDGYEWEDNYSWVMRILAHGIHVLWLQWTNSHGLQKSCGEKGMAWPLPKWERARGPESLTPAWTGYYCFSGYITLRMILIYYAQVPVGDYLLQITKERMLLITSKRRMLQSKGKSGYTPYFGCLAQTLGSYFKDIQ